MRFFSNENMVFRFSERLFDLVILSAAWVMLCIPVVTIGPATTALYCAVVKCVRHNEPGTLRNFFASFRQNFKVGAVTGIAVLALGILLLLSRNAVTVMAQTGDPAGVVLYYAEGVFLVFALGLACWLFPILSRFTVDVGGLFRAAVQLGVKHLPTTIVVSLLVAEAAELTLTYVYPIFFTPGLTMLLVSLFYERVFKKYTPDIPDSGDGGDEENRPWYLQ